MIESVIRFSIKNKFLILLFTLILIGGGLYSLFTIRLGTLPDITNNQVQVITVAPTLSTLDIERFITYPIELSMGFLPQVEEIRSISRFGLSVVTIVFKEETDMYLARQLVQEKLIEVREQIPKAFESPTMGPITTGLGEIYQYSLVVTPPYDTIYSLTDLRTIQDWIIKRQLTMIEGVIDVNSFGGYVKQYEIALNPQKLNALGISVTDVLEALKTNNISMGAAYVEKNQIANFIRIEGLIRSIKDIEAITIKTKRGVLIRLKDVADQIGYGHRIRYGAFTQDGREGVGGMILMLKDANSNEVIRQVKNRIDKIQKMLPKGIRIVPYHDRSELIHQTTTTIAKNLTEGALIVFFVLVLLLGSLRGGFITASVIPLSLLFAFLMMRILDVEANLMSLGAIDFGIIVDGAVIIVEGTVFLLEKRTRKILFQQEMDEITEQASISVMRSAFFGQLIILVVFVPILSLTGIEGKMFRPMAYTFGFAVLGSILLCLTYVPMVSAFVLKPTTKHHFLAQLEHLTESIGTKLIKAIDTLYFPLLQKALQWKKTIILFTVLLFGLVILIFLHMGGEFIPKLDEGDIAIQVQIYPGSALTEMIETTKRIETVLKKHFPEVQTSIARIGTAEIPTDPMPMDVADMIVALEKDKTRWKNGKTKEELIQKMKAILEKEFVGINWVFSQPIEIRFNELLTGVREDLVIRIFGEDLETLHQKAKEIASHLRTISGIRDINIERGGGMPQITVTFDREKLGQYGLTVEEVAQYISAGFAGQVVGTVYEGEKRYDLAIRFSKTIRDDLNMLQNLIIDLPDGTKIPIQEVAKVEFTPGPMQISRLNTFRNTYIGINLQGRDVESVVKDVQKVIAEKVELPPGYSVEYGGSFENLERAKKRLAIVVPIVLSLILLFIYFALGSFQQTLMIFLAVPFATIGGVLFLSLRNMPFSISAGVGFIILFGVAILHGLVLLNRLNGLKAEGIADPEERIYLATKERLRPILLTATAAITGFLPMALSQSPGAEVQRPLATVVIGGLLSETILTLILVPIIYSLLEKRKSRSPLPLIALLLILPTFQYAQEIHSVEEAIEIALKQNVELLMEAKQIQLQKENVAYQIPKLEVDLLYGQYQTFNNDFGVTIFQSFSSPLYYQSAKKWVENQVYEAQLKKEIKEAELKLWIRNTWSELAYYNDLIQIYQFYDSLYQKSVEAASLRYESGETTYLEKLTAETKRKHFENQIHLLQTEANKRILTLRLLLNDSTNRLQFHPPKNFKQPFQYEENFGSHPSISLAKARIRSAEAELNVAKSQMLPEWGIGHFNYSMIGTPTRTGDTATFFDRFMGIQGRIAFPLFLKPYKAQITTSRIKIELQKLELYNTYRKFETQFQEQLYEIQKQIQNLNYYETYALHQSEEILQYAYQNYLAGEIDYIAFFTLVNQSLDLKREYAKALLDYNLAINRFEFIINK